jgi:transposase
MIGWIRYQHRIAAVELKRRDELTVAELAAKLSVSHGVVYYWIERGILPARQQAANRPYWITLTEAKAQELQNWVQSSKRIAKASTKRQSA